jgi:hypothetical protein
MNLWQLIFADSGETQDVVVRADIYHKTPIFTQNHRPNARSARGRLKCFLSAHGRFYVPIWGDAPSGLWNHA